jgi:hypothetical protein
MISHTDIKKEMINTKARIRYKELKQDGNNKKIIPQKKFIPQQSISPPNTEKQQHASNPFNG